MSERTAAGVTVLRVVDELDMATTPRLRADVLAALEQQPSTLALDLSTCPFAGVDAIDQLISLTDEAQARGTTLVLTGLRPVVRTAVRLLGLESRLVCAEPAPAPRVPAG